MVIYNPLSMKICMKTGRMEDGLDFFGVLCPKCQLTIDMKRQKIKYSTEKSIFFMFFSIA